MRVINLLNTDKHLETSEFVDIMFVFGYYPLINKPTRVKNTKTTLFDNTITKTWGKHKQCLVLFVIFLIIIQYFISPKLVLKFVIRTLSRKEMFNDISFRRNN